MPDLYFLIEFPIFRDFDGNDIDALAILCEEKPYTGGEVVVREGEPADAMYILKSGVLEVCRMVDGERRHINLLSAGEFFGEMALIDGSPRSADVVCKEPAVLIRLSSDSFRSLKREHPVTALKIADVLLKTLSFRVRRSTSRALSSEVQAVKEAPLVGAKPPKPATPRRVRAIAKPRRGRKGPKPAPKKAKRAKKSGKK
jgi:CRP-like cAMP-binding protein